jgi:hypothetical protein
MDLWLVFLLLAVLCAVIGWLRSRPKGGFNGQTAALVHVQGDLMNYRPDVPTVWNENEISRQLATIQARPQLLAHYIDALKQRFILKTDDRTAQVRTQFLRTHIQQLELGKQYQSLVNDLKAMEDEQENRLLRLRIEHHELQTKHQQSAALDDLRLEKERLALEVEIEQLRVQKKTITAAPPAETKLTPEQQRHLRRMEIEDQMAQLDRQEEAALKKARNEDDRMRIQNMYADKREELRDQLAKNLI